MTSTSCNMWQETSESTSVTYHFAVGLAGQLLYLASQNRWAGACKAFSSSHYYFQNDNEVTQLHCSQTDQAVLG